MGNPKSVHAPNIFFFFLRPLYLILSPSLYYGTQVTFNMQGLRKCCRQWHGQASHWLSWPMPMIAAGSGEQSFAYKCTWTLYLWWEPFIFNPETLKNWEPQQSKWKLCSVLIVKFMELLKGLSQFFHTCGQTFLSSECHGISTIHPPNPKCFWKISCK